MAKFRVVTFVNSLYPDCMYQPQQRYFFAWLSIGLPKTSIKEAISQIEEMLEWQNDQRTQKVTVWQGILKTPHS